MRKEFGGWLQELRMNAGLSQSQLARELDLKYYSFISQIENGHGRVPPALYDRWAAAVGVPLRDFVRNVMRYCDPVTYRLLFGSVETAG